MRYVATLNSTTSYTISYLGVGVVAIILGISIWVEEKEQ